MQPRLRRALGTILFATVFAIAMTQGPGASEDWISAWVIGLLIALVLPGLLAWASRRGGGGR